MLGKNKKIKEELIGAFKFSNIISKKLLFSETHCDVYQIKLINDKTEYLMNKASAKKSFLLIKSIIQSKNPRIF